MPDPDNAPSRLFSRDPEIGVALHSRRVLVKKDPEKFNKFFKGYSYYLKAGIIEDKEANSSRHKDDILKLLRFESSQRPKGEMISLEEYVTTSKDGQQNIYYFTVP